MSEVWRFVLFAILPGPAAALNIRDYSPTAHARFLNFPENPISNPDFIYNIVNAADDQSVDLSGVGWYSATPGSTSGNSRQYTMVSPKHFVGANHFKPSTSGTLSFLSSEGEVRTYAIGELHSIFNEEGNATDLFIGTLEDEVLPTDGVEFQPYLSGEAGDYIGKELIFMGHRPGPDLVAGRGVFQSRSQVGRGTSLPVGSIQKTEAFLWRYRKNTATGNVNDAYVQGGDSGSPSLVRVGNRGALVGVHTAVGSSSSSEFNYDTFVPFYLVELNEIMAAEGYHMTRVVSEGEVPTTTLTLSTEIPTVIRAGYPVTIPVTIANVGDGEEANNLKFSQILPDLAEGSASGPEWVVPEEGNLIHARRGGLESDSETGISVTFTPAMPGVFVSSLTLAADEFPETSEEIVLEVIESFRSWMAEFPEGGLGDDPDFDGIPNLHEYAFGGDPTEASLAQPGTSENILPAVSESPSGVTVCYLRRTDAEARAITYELESTASLGEENWAVTSGEIEMLDAGEGFEKVKVEFPATADQLFFRVKVSLAE